jgi:hypothetical protein
VSQPFGALAIVALTASVGLVPHPNRPLLIGTRARAFVAAIFADPVRFGGDTFEIASDTITGRELGSMFTEAAGRNITYARFSEEVLTANPFLGSGEKAFEKALGTAGAWDYDRA